MSKDTPGTNVPKYRRSVFAKVKVLSQSIHHSLAAMSKVIRGTQLLTPEVQKLATALLNQEVRKQK